jgi:hypothetical protein
MTTAEVYLLRAEGVAKRLEYGWWNVQSSHEAGITSSLNNMLYQELQLYY